MGDDHVMNEEGYERTYVALNVKSLHLCREIMLRTKNISPYVVSLNKLFCMFSLPGNIVSLRVLSVTHPSRLYFFRQAGPSACPRRLWGSVAIKTLYPSPC